MKTLNLKLSLSTYNLLCDNGQLNPNYIKEVFAIADSLEDLPELKAPTVNYALKVDNAFHLNLKRCALENDLTLSEISGRLFEKYYKRG